MGNRGFKFSSWLFVVLISGSVEFSLSAVDDFDECSYRLEELFTHEIMSDVGLGLVRWNIKSGTSFVYSDLQVVDKLLNVLILGSPKIRGLLKGYLELRGDNCYTGFCKSFFEITQNMVKTLGRPLFEYHTFFYVDGNTKIKHWSRECGLKVQVDYRFPDEAKKIINADYQQVLKYFNAQCLKQDIPPGVSFFLLGALEINPAIFGKISSYSSRYKFTDFNGDQHKVEWLGTTGKFWTVRANLLPSFSDPSLTCVVQVFRTEVNEGNQFVLYFMPHADIRDKVTKTKCFEEILYNLRIYVERTIDKTLKAINEYPPDLTTLVFPVMNISTESDLSEVLNPVMSEIFKGEDITELYTKNVRLRDLRTCDYLYNKDREYDKAELPAEQVGYLHSPFVFTVVDKKSMIFIKTGAYFGP